MCESAKRNTSDLETGFSFWTVSHRPAIERSRTGRGERKSREVVRGLTSRHTRGQRACHEHSRWREQDASWSDPHKGGGRIEAGKVVRIARHNCLFGASCANDHVRVRDVPRAARSQ